MTDNGIRIAIAKACGWKRDADSGFWIKDGKLFPAIYLPDYLNDLNDMHEAEATLDDEQQEQFVAELANASQMRRTTSGINKDYWNVAHAPARQRAEALGRTLNLWKP